jgi:hypothetical protein
MDLADQGVGSSSYCSMAVPMLATSDAIPARRQASATAPPQRASTLTADEARVKARGPVCPSAPSRRFGAPALSREGWWERSGRVTGTDAADLV